MDRLERRLREVLLADSERLATDLAAQLSPLSRSSLTTLLHRVLVDDSVWLDSSVRGSARTLLCGLNPDVIEEFSIRLLSADGKKRFRAARVLYGVTTCNDEVERRLIDLLEETLVEIRHAAARTLVTLCPHAVPRLVDRWEGPSNEPLRETISLILTFRPDIRASDVWLWSLKHPNGQLRRRSATALRRAGRLSARTAACVAALVACGDPSLDAAADALISSKVDLRELVPRLLESLHHPEWQVRRSALVALGCVPDLADFREPAKSLVLAMFYDTAEHPLVRDAAGSILRSVFRRNSRES